ncbi:MAG: hypothetical protein JXA58_05115, partial [Dehalococcoidia bacterium]|nr:hypothetical protein [Dehalococcoidia bacterium]
MTKTFLVRLGCIALLSFLLLTTVTQQREAHADVGFLFATSDEEVGDAVEYLLDTLDADGDIGGFAVSAWAVMALAAAEEEAAVGE